MATVTFISYEQDGNTGILSFEATEDVLSVRYYYYFYPNWPSEEGRQTVTTPERPVYTGSSWTVWISPYTEGHNYYKLRFITAKKMDGSSFNTYEGLPVYFDVNTTFDVQPPPKAINPAPSDGAANVNKGITTFTWEGIPSYVASKFYFMIDGEWAYQGITSDTYWNVSSLDLQYASPYMWRVDTYDSDKDLTTTGDIWSLTTESLPVDVVEERPDDYEGDMVWGYKNGAYGWYEDTSILARGGGRYGIKLIVVGHNSVYYS